ncbi:MAG: AgmX/PglI C-terminal domain-containing protein, partial [Bdellovibrionales bacterium]|nr:AgmX/PglI C-terminal domain-containing protein [Bdellovibrionales bacterium]
LTLVDEESDEESWTVAPKAPLASDESKKEPVRKEPKAIPALVPGKTYAPPSFNKDPKEVVRPGKGSMVEIVVFWHERAISTHHFNPRRDIIIGGSTKADVFVPVMPASSSFTFVKMTRDQATICLSSDMEGELVRFDDAVSLKQLSRMNKLRDGGGHYELDLKQGEMVRVSFEGGVISLVVRYKDTTPKPLAAPLLDLSTSELTGVILSLVIASILGLYMTVYAPGTLRPDEAMIEEPLRKAIVKFSPPKRKTIVVKEEVPEEKPVEKQVVKVAEKKAVQKVAKAEPQVKQTQTPSKDKAGAPGKAGEVAPSKTPTKSKEVGSARTGGSQKTAAKDGANAKSVKPDPMKTGLMSAFGSKGLQKELDKAYSGSGELQGLADQATGTSGMAETRPGEGLGTKMKEGASGKGESIVGIAGVGTKGRGTGTTGYGTGGIGKKGSVEIEVGGGGSITPGTIDKEAIRRVIRDHIREIRTCYERALQRQPDLFGKIVFSWIIEEKGRVQSAKVVSNDLGNAEVANCIKSKLQTFTFPEPPANTLAEVTDYPFVFASQ